MIRMVVEILKWLFGSFDNTPSGASGRKLSAFALMLCVFWLHYKYANTGNAVEFLICDLSSIGLLLGIVTVQNIIDLKSNKTTKP